MASMMIKLDDLQVKQSSTGQSSLQSPPLSQVTAHTASERGSGTTPEQDHADRISVARSDTPNTALPLPLPQHSKVNLDIKQSSLVETGHGHTDPEPIQPYSIFTQNEKIFIAIIASLSTLLPTFAGNIYYQVIQLVAEDLDVTINQVNLTITAYLLLQGLAPSFIGNFSDSHGRRPALILAFVLFIAGCLGAAFPGSYAVLIATRCLQSAGSSSTIAIASAMVTDIVTSAQRGEYYSYVQLGGMIGPSLGPIVGGLLSHTWRWRSIFWFLTSFSSLVLVIILLILPETSRKIVGNGSIPAQRWNKPVFRKIKGRPRSLPKAHFNPLESFSLFLRWENAIILIFGGIIYSTQYYVLTTLPPQFEQHFGFTTVQTSLVFLATGVGTMLSALVIGRIQDYNFRRHARLLGIEVSNNRQQSLKEFPIEESRLQVSCPPLFLSLVSLIIYGWLLQKSSPAGSIVLLFVWAVGNAAAFSGFSNLIVDLNRDRPGTATAAMNLARNWIGAGVVAFSNPLTDGVQIGWANIVVAGYSLILFPAVLLVYHQGQRWRQRANQQQQEL